MMKYYKKFYEIGNNRYYTIVADDEMYIASESFLKLGKSRLFRKEKELNTGFKLLKFSAPIAQLFNALDNIEPCKKQRYNSDDLIIYENIDNKKLKDDIKQAYKKVIDEEIFRLSEEQAKYTNSNPELADSCEQYIEALKHIDPMDGLSLETPIHIGCLLVKTMLREGFKHLYTERVNAFANNIYMYEQDEFGTLTIYRIITIKNIVKTIDTFIYDKKLIECFLKTLYEEGR